MITKTIGTGGDYSDIGSAFVSIPYPWTDDYTFSIISDFTEVRGIIDGGDWGNWAGHTLKIESNGTKKTVTLPKTNFPYYTYNHAAYAFRPTTTNYAVLWIDNVFFKLTGSSGDSDLAIIRAWSGSGKIMTKIFTRCRFEGVSKSHNTALQITPGNIDPIYVVGCEFDTISVPMSAGNMAGTNRFIENCSITNCSDGFNIGTGSAGNTGTYRNCVAYNNTKDWAGGNSYVYLYNCYDSDNTIAGLSTTNTNCGTGVASHDFLSLDPSSKDFLRINNYSMLYGIGTIIVCPYNTSDIDGNDRPNASGLMSIGAYEPYQEYIMIKELECWLVKKQATFGAQGDDLVGSNYFPALPDSKMDIIPQMTDIETVSAIYDQDLAVKGFVNANLNLSCYMRSLGASTEPDYGLLAKAAGFAVSGPTAGKYTYTPIVTASTKTSDDLEVWHYLGGIGENASVLRKVGNVIGDWKIIGDVGKPVVFQLNNAKGIFISEAAATMVTEIVKDRTLIPPALPVTVSINSVVYKIVKFSFEGGNSIEQYIDCAVTYGFGDSEVTKKKIKFSFTCYANAALANPLDAVIAGDVVGDVSIIWGKTLYTTKILVDDPQFTDCKVVDIGGLTGWEVSGIATQNDLTIVQNNDYA